MTWQDMDPATHLFDPARAADVVYEIASSPDPRSGRAGVPRSTRSIARGLAEHYDSWAFGWFNATGSSPDSGLVVREVPASGPGGSELEQQTQRCLSALLQWRAWLEELAAVFEQFTLGPDADEKQIRQVREQAVAPLVTLVVERTGAGESWRSVFEQALAWYLESTGLPPAEAEELTDEVVDSEFESWVAPDEQAVDRVREAIGGYGA
ncbi:hypothetical protein [Streptomyces sp. NPDC050548]|uniref:hypothetical protein n=1 Tax=Streptomyces sp. NPDC050548 TaxID=3365629 RepID=UPI0037AE1F4E